MTFFLMFHLGSFYFVTFKFKRKVEHWELPDNQMNKIIILNHRPHISHHDNIILSVVLSSQRKQQLPKT